MGNIHFRNTGKTNIKILPFLENLRVGALPLMTFYFLRNRYFGLIGHENIMGLNCVPLKSICRSLNSQCKCVYSNYFLGGN